MIAAMGTGILADKYGRKHVVMSCLAVTIVSAIFQTFSNSFWMYLFFQMLTSLGQAGFFQTGFILGMDEYYKIINTKALIFLVIVNLNKLPLLKFFFQLWKLLANLTEFSVVL